MSSNVFLDSQALTYVETSNEVTVYSLVSNQYSMPGNVRYMTHNGLSTGTLNVATGPVGQVTT
ncbi:MAG: hypothetical protein ABI337_09145, partial [Nitrososphaera sp.]